MNTKHCTVCRKLLSGLKGSADTCSAACRQRKSRERRKRDRRAAEAFELLCAEVATEAAIAQPERNGEGDQIV